MAEIPVIFPCSYLQDALFDLPAVLDHATRALEDVDYDTLVGTGFSGGIVIPALALVLEKRYVLVRKDTDDSHHGKGRLIGSLGRRWVFVDDFVSTGATRTRVVDKIEQAAAIEGHSTEMVGEFMYASDWQRASGFYPTQKD